MTVQRPSIFATKGIELLPSSPGASPWRYTRYPRSRYLKTVLDKHGKETTVKSRMFLVYNGVSLYVDKFIAIQPKDNNGVPLRLWAQEQERGLKVRAWMIMPKVKTRKAIKVIKPSH